MLSNSSGQSIDPNTTLRLGLVSTLPALDTTMLANEQLRLSLNHPRKGLKLKADKLYDIVTRNKVTDLTNNEDIDKLSLSDPAKESFRHVLTDYNIARGSVDEVVQGAPTKRIRTQPDRFSTAISISIQNTGNKKRYIIEAEPLPIALTVETELNPNKNKRTRRETGSEGNSGATPAAVVTVAATTDADLPVVAATSANAVADAGATPAAVVTVAARDADLSVVAATSANAVADAAVVTPAAVVTVAARDADSQEVVNLGPLFRV